MPSPKCEALVTRASSGSPKLVRESILTPQPAANQALVKVKAVAQNPTDVQSLDGNAFGDGAVLGCDFVGTVEQIGSEVKLVAKGATVSGLIWGGEINGMGGYSEYSIADEKICFQVPEGISLEAASTVPLASCTSWLALFSKDCLNIERKHAPGTTVLIWGGASSVGLYAIQIAALYGMNVVTTASPKHADLLRSYGAKHVFDYHDSNVAAMITETAPDIKYVFDTIGNDSSSVTASQTINKSGGTLCTVRPGKAFTENVSSQTKVTDVLVWTAFLKDHQYKGFKWPAHKEDHELAAELFEKLPTYLTEDKIKPNTTKVFEEGLDAVPKGFQEYRDGKISNYKIVYRLA